MAKALARRTAKGPVPTPVRRPPTDKDRERRALDVAARRVSVWQVSAVTLLTRLRDRAASDPERAAIERALGQVPPEVIRAAELNMRGQWKPL